MSNNDLIQFAILIVYIMTLIELVRNNRKDD